MTEVVENLVLHILVKYFVYIVVDINLGAGIYDSLYLGEEFTEVHTLGRCKGIKIHLAVDGLDYRNLGLRFVGYAAYAYFVGTLDVIGLDMSANDIYKSLTIAPGFAGTYTYDILQFLKRRRISGGHGLERWVLEDDVRRQRHLACYFLTQVA